MSRFPVLGLLIGAVVTTAPSAAAQTPWHQPSAPADTRQGPPQAKLPPGAVIRLGSSQFRFGDTVSTVRFTHDSKRLLAASLNPGGNSSFCLFDGVSGQEVRRWQANLVFQEELSHRLQMKMLPRLGDSRLLPRSAVSANGLWLARDSAHDFRLANDRSVAPDVPAVEVLEIATGKILFQVKAKDAGDVLFLQFTPDSKQLAGICQERKKNTENEPPWGRENTGPTFIRLWDTTGKEVRTFGKAPLPAGQQPFRAEGCFFSPDGKYLAAVGTEGFQSGVVRLWSLSEGEKTWRLTGQRDTAGPLVFSPDGKQLAEAGPEKVRLWDAATGKLVKEFHTPFPSCHALLYAPDGNYLAAGDHKEIRVWQLPAAKLTAQVADAEAVLFAPDSRTFATLAGEKISVRTTATGQVLHQWSGPFENRFPLGTNFSNATQGLGWPFVFTPDSKYLLTTESLTGTIVRLSVVEGTKVYPPGDNRGYLCSLRFAPDGRRLATGGTDGAALWDVPTGKYLHTLDRRSGGKPVNDDLFLGNSVLNVAFGPTGQQVAAYWGDGTATVWEGPTGRLLWRRQHSPAAIIEQTAAPRVPNDVRELRRLPQFPPTALSLSPDGQALITVDGEGEAHWHQLRTGQLLHNRTIPIPRRPLVWSAVVGFQVGMPLIENLPPELWLAPDGRTVVVLGAQNATLYELSTGLVRRRIPEGQGLALAENGRRLATVQDDLVRLTDLDVTAATRVVRLDVPLLALALSPDGKFLAGGCEDGSLRLWDAATATLLAHRDLGKEDPKARITALTFSANGQSLASAGMDATVLIWDVAALLPKTAGPLPEDELQQLWQQLASPKAASAGQAMARLAAAPGAVAFLKEQSGKKWLLQKNSLQAARTVELLERLGSLAAQQLLETLARESSAAPWSAAARGSLERLAVSVTRRNAQAPADRRLPRASVRLGARQWQHGSPVSSVRFLPDGKTVLTSTTSGWPGEVALQFWDAGTGQFLHKTSQLDHGPNVLEGAQRGHISSRDYSGPTFIPCSWAVSRDGRYYVGKLDHYDSRVQVRDLITGKVVSEVRHEQIMVRFAQFGTAFGQFTPDGRYLVLLTVNPQAPIRIFAVCSGRAVSDLKLGPAEKDFLPVYFNISPDGHYLAAIGRHKKNNGAVRIWDLFDNRPPRALADLSPRYSPLVFSPDGKLLAVIVLGDKEKTPQLRLFDPATGKLVHDLGAHPEPGVHRNANPEKDSFTPWTNGLVFSPDGQYLASIDTRHVHLWQVQTMKALPALEVGTEIHQMVFAPNSRLLALRTEEGVNVFDVPFWGRKWKALLPDRLGGYVGMGRGESRFHQLQQGLGGLLTFSPNGQRLLVPFGQTIRQWDVATGREIVPEGRQPLPAQLVVSPGGRIAAAVSAEGVVLWDVRTGKQLHQLQEKLTLEVPNLDDSEEVRTRQFATEPATPLCGAFAPSGKVFAAAYNSGHVVLWEVPTGKRLRIWKEQDNPLAALQFSPDGKSLTAVDQKFTRLQWDLGTGRLLATVRLARSNKPKDNSEPRTTNRDVVEYTGGRFGPRTRVESSDDSRSQAGIGLAADGRLGAEVGDRSLLLLELASGQSRFQIPILQAAPPLVFAPDGRFLVYVGDGTLNNTGEVRVGQPGLQFLDVLTGQPLRFFGPLHNISSAAFSPDGRLLAAAGQEGVMLWETATGTLLSHQDKHRGPATAVAFSPDGRRLLSAGVDCTILVYQVADLTRKAPCPEPTQDELNTLWQQLGSADGTGAFTTMLRLSKHPAQTTLLLQAKIRPVAQPDQAQLFRWLHDLDHDNFKVRARAVAQLTRASELARPVLQQALTRDLSLEHHQRIDQLLARLTNSPPLPDQVRLARIIELLERMDTPASRRLLAVLAQGAPAATITGEAQAALRRLGATEK